MKILSFNDSHMHFHGIGYNTATVDLSNVETITEMIVLLNGIKHMEYIIARGWNHTNFKENRYPTKTDLNEVYVDAPIVLTRTCGHVLVCNDAMMKLAGINKSTPQVEGGTFDCSTGIFAENALSLIYSALPKPSKEDVKQYFIMVNEILL